MCGKRKRRRRTIIGKKAYLETERRRCKKTDKQRKAADGKRSLEPSNEGHLLFFSFKASFLHRYSNT